MGERYRDYDAFARFYDRHWGPMGAARHIELLDRHVLDALPAGGRILDLCCELLHQRIGLTTPRWTQISRHESR